MVARTLQRLPEPSRHVLPPALSTCCFLTLALPLPTHLPLACSFWPPVPAPRSAPQSQGLTQLEALVTLSRPVPFSPSTSCS